MTGMRRQRRIGKEKEEEEEKTKRRRRQRTGRGDNDEEKEPPTLQRTEGDGRDDNTGR